MPAAPPGRDMIRHAEEWLDSKGLKLDDAAVLAEYANEVAAATYRQAASMLPNTVQGVRGATLVSLDHLILHLYEKAARLEKYGHY